jgi:aerobic carbon-monoxide dehydrogenase large subunit
MTTPLLPKMIGERIKRREDPRLITGLGSFVDDMQLPGMLHLAFKRCDIAHGTITRIDKSAAEGMPGVKAVYTGAEIQEILPPMPVFTPFPAPTHHTVAAGRVRHVGEPVAVVVATDRYLAQDASDAIEVDYHELPAIMDPEKAAMPDAPALHEDFTNILEQTGSNIGLVLPVGTGVDPVTLVPDDTEIEAAFAEADVIVSERIVNQRLAPTPMEPRGCLADYDRGTGKLSFWSSTQAPHLVRTYLAGSLGIGENDVRVVAPDVGGGFGAKINIYGEDYVAAALSRKLAQPIKWTESRSEAFFATNHGRDIIAYVDLAAKSDGRLLGLRTQLIADVGAYDLLMTAMIPTLSTNMLSGVYNIPAIRAVLTEAFTNKTPTDAYRGAGRPEGIFLVERMMDALARKLEMDPAELRRKNFIQPDQFPFETQAGHTYDSGEYERTLDRALQNSNWEGLKAERDEARAEGRLVGLGLAFYVEVAGIGFWEHANVTVARDGRVTAAVGTSSHGQGHETAFSQMLADQFGIRMDSISIVHGDTDIVKAGNGTFGSRSQTAGGTVLLKAGDKVKDKMAKFAAFMLEVQPADLVFENGRISVAGVPDSGLPFEEVAAFAHAGAFVASELLGLEYPQDIDPGLSEEAFWDPPGGTFPFGCYISMVEVDRETGEVELKKLLAVDDAGTIINPLIVEGQIHGGIAQGVGQALHEEVVYDDDGQLLTGSFMDYGMPRATDFPMFELDNTVTKSPLTPLGTKGVGEAGTIGSTPSVANAVIDALSEFGVTHIDMMYRPEKLWRIIQDGSPS